MPNAEIKRTQKQEIIFKRKTKRNKQKKRSLVNIFSCLHAQVAPLVLWSLFSELDVLHFLCPWYTFMAWAFGFCCHHLLHSLFTSFHIIVIYSAFCAYYFLLELLYSNPWKLLYRTLPNQLESFKIEIQTALRRLLRNNEPLRESCTSGVIRGRTADRQSRKRAIFKLVHSLAMRERI